MDTARSTAGGAPAGTAQPTGTAQPVETVTPARAGRSGAGAGRARRRAVRRFVPPQHGAWAMLLVPYLGGVLVAGWRWPHAPLLVAWLAAYLGSYYALQAVKTRRWRRFRPQLVTYGAVAAPLAALVVTARPAVLWFAPAYALLVAVNVGYAWRRDERALVNDLASVAQSCLMVFVVATVADVPAGDVVGVFVALLAYFTGTVFYVKTMIRERGSAGYRRASVAYHLGALAVAVRLGPALVAVFAVLLVRAWALPGRALTPKRVGVLEIVHSALLLVAATVTWA